ncbi:MAG: hypothetical protein Q9M14_04815, partial [Mariprofundaceae bacterium]|nr:hypothetical protein [Mariprofundaceae bacterium]
MIFSPVSRLPVTARSYLTSIAVLMLVLVAVHFSIQAWGQQQAQQWITAWEKKYGGHVGEARVQMLRGALTIHDMQWKSKGIDFRAPFVLLRGNLSDSIEQIDIREIVLQGAKVTVSNALFQQILQKKTNLSELLPWARLLDGVRDMHSYDMDIVVQAGLEENLPLQPLVVHHANLSATPQQRQWQLLGDVWDGFINLSSQNNGQDITWSNLDAMQLTESLGLSVIEGRVTGKASWQKKQLSGDIVWREKALSSNKKAISEGKVSFQGVVDESDWQVDIQTMDWPLQIFSASTPILYGRKLNGAYLTGKLDLKRKQQGWQASMKQGVIRNLNYSDESKAVWYLQHIDFKKAKLVWPQRTLRMDKVVIEQGNWAVDSSASTAAILPSAWNMNFPKVSFKAIKLGDIAKHIWLPDMQGELSLHGQRLNMKASSDSDAMGQWELQAQGVVAEKFDIKVRAKHVPLLNFRDALPQTFVKDARLSGDVGLDLKGVWHTDGWQLHGDMDGHNIMWNRGAWLWRAEQMQLKAISFGSIETPSADVWEVHNWAGQTSLTPWSQATNMSVSQKQQKPVLSLDGWKLKHIMIDSGKFSLGQEDAVWFESDMVKLDDVEENNVIN